MTSFRIALFVLVSLLLFQIKDNHVNGANVNQDTCGHYISIPCKVNHDCAKPCKRMDYFVALCIPDPRFGSGDSVCCCVQK
ncbi:hypothetical protein P3S67_024702 [Capsicum chacoense]